ncbi:MAG: 4-(cytidine 5'-diphospho)-2-C-methyl-D-erythritol kinase [Piscinibacter sp.]|uniref:4-(cytidine 5'-diphospho)-2-C-methyl-D-erythritol kinase n=1 Tax=Piscinibacter sp. TaxID=1903157 RepID=UPI001B7AFE7A|nr:4-(cytidine 5'-diphospho)-2-C-methyl-D-erythritol kinase [Piscinibacter sp.]MBP5989627.1 4-(cytidine 5'-diphospho)-2-C-methyl-D-erythritol kinase [Piscinibacter sp.]MBP6027947.1 4-(cytidine 5'-diphospho)-2-C-methyl-D-erythritol kinase [Piscinibacter sp.]
MGLRSLLDVAAPAKLNLFLHVVGRRADGYHLLQSVFVLIDWCDTLHFERRADGRLARHDLGAALPDDDLCLRAARLLQAESGTRLGADISIEKHVPWGAGMGGGSSDAASTLLALNRLWGLNLPRERLAALGLKLGADVPFFIGGHNAFVEGIGERLTPLPVPPAWFAVVKPPAAIATSAIFGSPLLVRNTEAVILAGFLADTAGGFGRNDLQAPAEAHCAEVGVAREILQRRFGNARMTGSGSAVFARAGTGAEPTAAMPADLPPGWVGRMCRSQEQHPLVGWAPD